MANAAQIAAEQMNQAIASREEAAFVVNRNHGNTARGVVATELDEAYAGTSGHGTPSALKTAAMSSGKTGIVDDNIAHLLSPYTFRFNKECKKYSEMLLDMYKVSDTEKGKEKEFAPDFAKNGQLTPEQLIPFYTGSNGKESTSEEQGASTSSVQDTNWTRFNIEDTSIGGNTAINCRWGFGRDDDIIAPLQALVGKPELGGLGRVYFENYQIHQQVLSMTFGVPEFQSLWQFYGECVDSDLANDVNSGESRSVANMFGSVIGGAVRLALKIPITLLRIPDYIADMLDPSERITRYYELRPAMPMYYKFANTIFCHVAVLMGMTQNGWWYSDKLFPKAGTGGRVESKSSGNALSTLLKYSLPFSGVDGKGEGNEPSEAWQKAYQNSMPPWMGKHGPNIWDILSERDFRSNLMKHSPGMLEQYLAKTNPKDKADGGFFDAFSNRTLSTAAGADKFISFRINKSTDSSETLGNQTGQSAVAQFLNGAASKGRDARFSMGGGMVNQIAKTIPIVGTAVKAVADMASGLLNNIKFVDVATTIMTGSGFFDIPEIWTGSSFTKSYSFNLTFRPAAGDNGTILGDEYLPLCLLLAAACPRTVGTNSYSSPFLLRAYCKGMFAVPLGIIESMTITRGSSEFGWSLARLPTVLTVSMSIKDLAPVMHLAMADNSSILRVFGANSSMQEYMHTLAGSGLNERILFSSSFARRWALSAQLIRSTWLNPNFHATMLGNTAFFRSMGSLFAPSMYE